MKTPFRRILLLLTLLVLFAGNSFAQDLLDYTNSLKYANYLFTTGQYKLAIAEFERVTFLNPNDTLAKLQLVRSYRFVADYASAISKIESCFRSNQAFMPEEFSYEYLKDLISDKKYPSAIKFLTECTTIDPGSKSEYNMGLLIIQNRWKEALNLVSGDDRGTGYSIKSEEFSSLVVRKLTTPCKSPPLAGLMSVVVPGAGKIYCGNWMDGLYSLVFITGSTWLTSRSYARNGTNFGTILLGSLTFSFYSANIYGSVKMAKNYNEHLNISFRNEAEDILLKDK